MLPLASERQAANAHAISLCVIHNQRFILSHPLPAAANDFSCVMNKQIDLDGGEKYFKIYICTYIYMSVCVCVERRADKEMLNDGENE